jgi:hypothetical protein
MSSRREFDRAIAQPVPPVFVIMLVLILSAIIALAGVCVGQ